MDIRYNALGAFWPTEDDRPAAERPVSPGKTSWVVPNAQVVPSHDDMIIAAIESAGCSQAQA